MLTQYRRTLFFLFIQGILILPSTLPAQDAVPVFGERAEEPVADAAEPAAPLSALSAYSDYRWRPVPIEKFAPAPVLESGESISVSSGAAYAENKVFWVVQNKSNGKTSFYLLAWSSVSGKTERSAPVGENIRGLTWDQETKLLLVRLRNAIAWYDIHALSETKRLPFAKLNQEWRDLAIVGSELIAINGAGDGLDICNKNDLTQHRTVSTGALKSQRLLALEGNTLLLWSSYWGNRPRTFDLATGQETGILHATFPYKAMRKAAMISPGRIGLFDIADSNVFGVAVRSGFSLVNLFDGAEIDDSGLAYRFAPIRQTIRAVLQITAKTDLGESVVVVSLPHATTYAQQITAETFSGETLTDPYGNRFAAVKLPVLKRGVRNEIELYRADIIRYQTSFDILSASATLQNGSEFSRYLGDHEIFQLSDPLVAETRNRVMAGADTYTQKIIATHTFAMSIKPLWDGKNEPVPAVLRNMHGGCNEHTRVIVALLRSAGIPARYAWNHLWRGVDEKEFTQDHAIAEAWLTGVGWVPLEGLGRRAGYITPYIFFNVGYPDSSRVRPKTTGEALNLRKNNAKIVWRVDH
ncbi:MAG: transglutaminase-like domain-containing protein [Turneriella sp.]